VNSRNQTDLREGGGDKSKSITEHSDSLFNSCNACNRKIFLIVVDLVHSWRIKRHEKRTLYQTKLSLSLHSRDGGCRLVPHDVKYRSTCARTFLRTRVTHVSQEERSESMRQKPRIFFRSLVTRNSRGILFIGISLL